MKHKIIESATVLQTVGIVLTALKETVERNSYVEGVAWNSIKDNKIYQNRPQTLGQKRRRLLVDSRVLLNQVQNLLHVYKQLSESEICYQRSLRPRFLGIQETSRN